MTSPFGNTILQVQSPLSFFILRLLKFITKVS
jgi:hypothetical protein